MRWLVALLTACCLMAVGGARPDVARGRGHDAQLARAVVGAVAMAPRRDGGVRRDARAGAFVVPVVAETDAAVRAWDVASGRAGSSVCERPAPVPVSRGPPRG